MLNSDAKNSGFLTVADNPMICVFEYKFFKRLIKPLRRVPLSSSSIMWISSIKTTPRLDKAFEFPLLKR